MRTLPLLLSVLIFAAMPAFAADTKPVENPAAIAPQNEPLKAKDKDEEQDGKPLKVTKNTGGAVDAQLIKNAPLSTDFVMGDRKAPLVMVEYASLSCPHCGHFANTVLPKLEEKYINTGKLAYILRMFPLNEPAMRGAMLLDCVGEASSEKYYTFARVLFDAQSKWAFDENFMTGLETIANVGGLSKKQFQGCTNNMDREMKVLKAKKDANDQLHIPQTPYIYIGGEVFEGAPTFEAISPFIDAKLEKLAKRVK